MNSIILKITLFLVLVSTITMSHAQKEYDTYSGVYKNNTSKTIMCGCSTQGLLTYTNSKGNPYTLTVCFDTEPGDFYQIFDGEKVTLTGNVKSVVCKNDKKYPVLYVVKSQLPAAQRKMVLPEMLKKSKSSQTKKTIPKVTPGEDYKVSGVFRNNTAKTIMCDCTAQGLLKYAASDGNSYTLTICFDTQPGSYYEIFDGEKITVEGDVKNMKCENGKNYNVLYVEKSTLPNIQRKEIYTESAKNNKGNESNKNLEYQTINNNPPPPPVKKDKQVMMEGSFMVSGSTKADWSDYNHCKKCGVLNNNKSQPIVFDRINSMPEGMTSNIRVWGASEGSSFYVTRWEYQK